MTALTLATLSADTLTATAGAHTAIIDLTPDRHARFGVIVAGPGYVEAMSAASLRLALEAARSTVARTMEEETQS